MKKIIFSLILIAFSGFILSAETILEGKMASEKIKGAELIRYKDGVKNPSFIRFTNERGPLVSEIDAWIQNTYGLEEGFSFSHDKTSEDALGYSHLKFHQFYNGVKVEFASLTAHVLNGRVVSFSGSSSSDKPTQGYGLDEVSSLQLALNHVNAQVYKWEIPAEEAHLKWETSDNEATYYPVGEKVYLSEKLSFAESKLIPCWKFDVYALAPLYRAYVFVDANSGMVILENHRLKDVDTVNTANTSYSGVRNITTDYYATNKFRLRETGRGNGVQTFDMLNGTSHGAAVDITSDTNHWNDTLRAEYATDAHWGAEKVYDYYYTIHGRNSIDDNGSIMRSYVHYGTNYSNAFWDGQRMTYGDGNSSITAFTTLDIAGHEITHGVDQYTSDLVYSYESGALDESFADIFGNAVEALYKPDPVKNWLVGEEIGTHLRSMSNPKTKADPDTYQGFYWYTGTNDNGGVHTNSGVQNHWFYLLSVGGSGTNDNNDTYSVTGITIQKAEQIAYRNRAYYLTSNSDYEDSRFFSIQSAYDIYGPCTQELASTVKAWYAVGVGADYSPTVESDFSSSVTDICFLPAQIHFTNLSNYNSVSYLWDFGDNTTSTAKDPVHTYSKAGKYTVKLIATGNAMCGSDTEKKNKYINVDPPADVQVGPYSICDGYPAKIKANAQNVAFWFSDTSGSPIYIGNPYVSPPLFKDTVFYAANGTLSSTQSVGPADNTIGGGSNYSGNRYLSFDVHDEMTLLSVKVFSYTNTSRTIELRDNMGNTLNSKTLNIPTGEQTINLGFTIPAGTDYQLGVSLTSTSDFFRNNTGADYPYEIGGLVSITGPGSAPPSYYYFFYDWKVKGRDCVGKKLPVQVTVDLDPGCVPYVGLSEEDISSKFNVYPNPSNGSFTVDVNLIQADKLSFRLMDSKGMLVFKENSVVFEQGTSRYNIDEDGLAKGIYLLQIEGNSTSMSQRIIIK